MLEVVVMRGDQVLGQRQKKRERTGAVNVMGEDGNGREALGEEGEQQPNSSTIPPLKKLKIDWLETMTNEELVLEMKRRRLKPGGRNRDEMLACIRNEDKTQGRISWGDKRAGDQCQGQRLRGAGDTERKVEERSEEAGPEHSEAEEAEWEDANSGGEGEAPRSETTLGSNAGNHNLRRPTITNVGGRLRGQGRTRVKGGKTKGEDKVQDEGRGS